MSHFRGNNRSAPHRSCIANIQNTMNSRCSQNGKMRAAQDYLHIPPEWLQRTATEPIISIILSVTDWFVYINEYTLHIRMSVRNVLMAFSFIFRFTIFMVSILKCHESIQNNHFAVFSDDGDFREGTESVRGLDGDSGGRSDQTAYCPEY